MKSLLNYYFFITNALIIVFIHVIYSDLFAANLSERKFSSATRIRHNCSHATEVVSTEDRARAREKRDPHLSAGLLIA